MTMGKINVLRVATVLALSFNGSSAFTTPLLATRAVVKKAPAKKAAPKKVAPKKVEPKKAVASTGGIGQKASNNKNFIYSSQGYVSIASQAENFKLPPISGGGNRKPQVALGVWDFSDPKLQIERDPKFYAEAAKTRLVKQQEFVYEDGLTELERKQRGNQALFLTGSAKSQIDSSSIADVQGVDYFGLSGDRFQLLFIAVFGLFTLVGCLSGNLKL